MQVSATIFLAGGILSFAFRCESSQQVLGTRQHVRDILESRHLYSSARSVLHRLLVREVHRDAARNEQAALRCTHLLLGSRYFLCPSLRTALTCQVFFILSAASVRHDLSRKRYSSFCSSLQARSASALHLFSCFRQSSTFFIGSALPTPHGASCAP